MDAPNPDAGTTQRKRRMKRTEQRVLEDHPKSMIEWCNTGIRLAEDLLQLEYSFHPVDQELVEHLNDAQQAFRQARARINETPP